MLNDGKEVCGIGYWAGSFSFATHPPPFGLRGGGDAPPRNLEKLLAPCAGEDKNSWCMFCPIFRKKFLRSEKVVEKFLHTRRASDFSSPGDFNQPRLTGGGSGPDHLITWGGGPATLFPARSLFSSPPFPPSASFLHFAAARRAAGRHSFFWHLGCKNIQQMGTNGSERVVKVSIFLIFAQLTVFLGGGSFCSFNFFGIPVKPDPKIILTRG